MTEQAGDLELRLGRLEAGVQTVAQQLAEMHETLQDQVAPPDAASGSNGGVEDRIARLGIALEDGFDWARKELIVLKQTVVKQSETGPGPEGLMSRLERLEGSLGRQAGSPARSAGPARMPDADAFLGAADRVLAAQRTGLDRDRLQVLWEAVRNAGPLDLPVAEVGTGLGGSAYFLASAYQALYSKAPELHVLDTFNGCPPERISEGDANPSDQAERTDPTSQQVVEYLKPFEPVSVHEGEVAATLPSLGKLKFSLVHLDLGYRLPTLDCLRFFERRLPSGGVIVVGDYGAGNAGVGLAVHEFLTNSTNFQLWPLPTEQALLIKLPATGHTGPLAQEVPTPLAEHRRPARSRKAAGDNGAARDETPSDSGDTEDGSFEWDAFGNGILSARLDHLVEISQPLVLISQVQRSGGTLLNQLLDGHHQLHTHPTELHIGHPDKWTWPVLDLDADGPTWFKLLREKKVPQFFTGGYSKLPRTFVSYKHEERDVHPFLLAPSVQRSVFMKLIGHRKITSQRDVLDCYMTSYFNSWLDYQGLYGADKRWVVAFAPRLAWTPGRERFFGDYPTGRIISCVRDPGAFFVSARRFSPDVYGDLDAAMELWLRSTRETLVAAEERSDQVFVLLFEDLVARTEEVMRSIAAFLEIDFDESLTRPTFNGRPIRANSSFPVESHGVLAEPGSRQDSLTDDERERIRAMTESEHAAAKDLAAGYLGTGGGRVASSSGRPDQPGEKLG